MIIPNQRTPEDVAYFCSLLRHIEGRDFAGKPFILAPWQFNDLIRPIFGTYTAAGYRRYRKVYCRLPRKNGKTTLGAAIALFLLFCDGEPGAQVISAAATKPQAAVCFDIAATMVDRCPMLKSRCQIYDDRIETFDGSTYKVISSAADTKDGLNLHGIIFDELHAQKTRDLWEVLDNGRGSRRQPLTFAITTPGKNQDSICYEIDTYAQSILEGSVVDDGFLPVLYGAGPNDDWTSEETWRKANPGYGVSCFKEFFEEQVAQARLFPEKEMDFRRKNLGQWTSTQTRWIPIERWDACEGSIPDLRGRECIAGLDMSGTLDLSGLVLAFEVDGKFYLLPFAWAPRGAIERREKRNAAKYWPWVRSGHLFMSEGDTIDEDAIFAKIQELSKIYRIKNFRVDRFNAGYMSNRISQLTNVEYFGQGFASMGNATRDFETLVYEKNVIQDGHPVLRWCVSNTSVKTDEAGNKKPDKKVSREKIDLCVAAIMALSGARVRSAGNGRSVYETRGLITA